jgi:hypothetical protein
MRLSCCHDPTKRSSATPGFTGPGACSLCIEMNTGPRSAALVRGQVERLRRFCVSDWSGVVGLRPSFVPGGASSANGNTQRRFRDFFTTGQNGFVARRILSLPGFLRRHSGAHEVRTRNLEIPGLVLTHQPGMTIEMIVSSRASRSGRRRTCRRRRSPARAAYCCPSLPSSSRSCGRCPDRGSGRSTSSQSASC